MESDDGSFYDRFLYSSRIDSKSADCPIRLKMKCHRQLVGIIADHSQIGGKSMLLTDNPTTCMHLLKALANIPRVRISFVAGTTTHSRCVSFVCNGYRIVSASAYCSILAKASRDPLEDHWKKRHLISALLTNLPSPTMLLCTNPSSLLGYMNIIPHVPKTSNSYALDWFEHFLKKPSIIWCKFPKSTVITEGIHFSDKKQMYNRIMVEEALPLGNKFAFLPNQREVARVIRQANGCKDPPCIFIELEAPPTPSDQCPEWLEECMSNSKYVTFDLLRSLLKHADSCPLIRRGMAMERNRSLSIPMEAISRLRTIYPNAVHLKSAANSTYGSFSYRKRFVTQTWSK